MNRPASFPALRPGDRVAVVSPSGVVDAGHLASGIAWLSTRYQIVDDPRCIARDGFLAGSDTERAGALIDALEDPQVRAIFVSRGGYGAMRVLERQGERLRSALRLDPKPIVGFSDVTALHALWAHENVASVHGPMVVALGRGAVRDADRDETLSVLEAGALPTWTGLTVVRDGRAAGRAAGGNLAVLAALAGTPFAQSLVDSVLFIEDVGERPYRVDRMLTQLRLAGALREVRGVVIGDFTECEPGPDGVSVGDVLRDRLSDLGVPVLANAPFGHGTRQRPFVYGGIVHLDDGCVRFDSVEVSAKPRSVC